MEEPDPLDMPEEDEEALQTWASLARFFNCSERKIIRYKDELLACGAIFYMNLGRPPRKTVCAFPHRLRKWAGLKGQKGEII
jgi:hypothetical protein